MTAAGSGDGLSFRCLVPWTVEYFALLCQGYIAKCGFDCLVSLFCTYLFY